MIVRSNVGLTRWCSLASYTTSAGLCRVMRVVSCTLSALQLFSSHRNLTGFPANQRCKMTTAIPESPTARLRRKATAEALLEKGFPVSEKTLATKAVRVAGRLTNVRPYRALPLGRCSGMGRARSATPRSRSAANPSHRACHRCCIARSHRCAGASKLLAASVRPVVVVWKRGYALHARRRPVERAAFWFIWSATVLKQDVAEADIAGAQRGARRR